MGLGFGIHGTRLEIEASQPRVSLYVAAAGLVTRAACYFAYKGLIRFLKLGLAGKDLANKCL